ncbi:hypothetical protein DPMN_175995 [Dreissena polymorpha]|uniref:Uncharacterized protein n=1 Tax=Dreissena polymorpha TaxID=45954 RepID=A0A9D4E8A2_DREPO|nr:hypothetical protein DPMN_175995 [Dreissena polymorpha]
MFLTNDPENKYLYGELGPRLVTHCPSPFRSSLNTFLLSITSSKPSPRAATPCGCAEC